MSEHDGRPRWKELVAETIANRGRIDPRDGITDGERDRLGFLAQRVAKLEGLIQDWKTEEQDWKETETSLLGRVAELERHRARLLSVLRRLQVEWLGYARGPGTSMYEADEIIAMVDRAIYEESRPSQSSE